MGRGRARDRPTHARLPRDVLFAALGLPATAIKSIADDGSHVWVQSTIGPIAELDASTGAEIQVLDPAGSRSWFTMTVDATHLWVLDGTGWLREFDLSTGAQVGMVSISIGSRAINGDKLVSNGTNVFLMGTTLQTINIATSQVTSGPQLNPEGMGPPSGVAVDGAGNLWVVSQGGLTLNSDGSIAEFDGTTGALLTSHTEPDLISAGWILPTPAGVWVLATVNLRAFDAPIAANLREFDATTGATLATVTPPLGGGFTAFADDGTNLWVTALLSNEILLLSDSTGAQAAVLYSSPEEVGYPSAIATDKSHVWISEANSNTVTEFTAGTEAFVRVIDGPSYQFDTPGALASNGTDVFVASASNIVTEFDATTGASVQTIPVTGPIMYVAVDSTGHLWIQTATDLSGYQVSDGTLFASIPFATPLASPTCNFASNGSSLFVRQIDNSKLFAIDMATGATEWASKVTGASGCWVSLSGRQLFTGGRTGILKLSVATGASLGSYNLTPPNLPPGEVTEIDGVAADSHNIWVVTKDNSTNAYSLQRIDRSWHNDLIPVSPLGTYLPPPAPRNLVMASDGSVLWLFAGAQLSASGPNS